VRDLGTEALHTFSSVLLPFIMDHLLGARNQDSDDAQCAVLSQRRSLFSMMSKN
jgi:hypothetical protein